MINVHYFVKQNRKTGIFQCSFLVDKTSYLAIVDDEINNILTEYPLFEVRYYLESISLIFKHNNRQIHQQLVSKIRFRLENLDPTQSDFVTLSC